MSLCESCLIDEKLMQCCGRLPMTGERSPLTVAPGRTVMACPNLSPAGRCMIYDSRPQGCRIFFCEAFESDRKSFINPAAPSPLRGEGRVRVKGFRISLS